MIRWTIRYERRAKGAIGRFSRATPKDIVAPTREEAWSELWELEDRAGWEIHHVLITEAVDQMGTAGA